MFLQRKGMHDLFQDKNLHSLTPTLSYLERELKKSPDKISGPYKTIDNSNYASVFSSVDSVASSAAPASAFFLPPPARRVFLAGSAAVEIPLP